RISSRPELPLGPAQDQIAVEEAQGGALGRRDVVGHDGGDHYVAFVVEGDGERGARRAIGYGDLIGPAATFHPADGDRAPVAQSVEPGAEQLEVTHAVEFG